jgi:hypothetical protein
LALGTNDPDDPQYVHYPVHNSVMGSAQWMYYSGAYCLTVAVDDVLHVSRGIRD